MNQQQGDPYFKKWMTDKEYKVIQRILTVFFLASIVLFCFDFLSGSFLFMTFLIAKVWLWKKDDEYGTICELRATYGEKATHSEGDIAVIQWREMNGAPNRRDW